MSDASDASVISKTDDDLDDLVEQASVPNLATLFQQAKDKGLIQPVTVYGTGAPTTSATAS